jgi:hypothetical protein
MKSRRNYFRFGPSMLLVVGLLSAFTSEAGAIGFRFFQDSQDVATLEVGKPIERELRGGEKHAYPI